MLASRLAAFTIALLLLSRSIEAAWGWYFVLAFLTLITIRDLVSFVAFLLSSALLVGIVDGGQAAYIALTIFTSVTLLVHQNLVAWPRGRYVGPRTWQGYSRQ